MPDKRAEAIERVARAEEARRELACVEPILAKRRRDVIQSVFVQLKAGALDPTSAVEQWIRLYEIDRLERALRDEIKAGEKASRRLSGERLDRGNGADPHDFPYT